MASSGAGTARREIPIRPRQASSATGSFGEGLAALGPSLRLGLVADGRGRVACLLRQVARPVASLPSVSRRAERVWMVYGAARRSTRPGGLRSCRRRPPSTFSVRRLLLLHAGYWSDQFAQGMHRLRVCHADMPRPTAHSLLT